MLYYAFCDSYTVIQTSAEKRMGLYFGESGTDKCLYGGIDNSHELLIRPIININIYNDYDYCNKEVAKSKKAAATSKKDEDTLPPINLLVGDIIPLGRYEQDGDDTEKEDIQWIVVSVETDGKAVLISKDCLAIHENNDKTWQDSIVRKWLNEDFYNEAFSETEKSLVNSETHWVRNHAVFSDREQNKEQKAVKVEDKVFLMGFTDYYLYGENIWEMFLDCGISTVAKKNYDKLNYYEAYYKHYYFWTCDGFTREEENYSGLLYRMVGTDEKGSKYRAPSDKDNYSYLIRPIIKINLNNNRELMEEIERKKIPSTFVNNSDEK